MTASEFDTQDTNHYSRLSNNGVCTSVHTILYAMSSKFLLIVDSVCCYNIQLVVDDSGFQTLRAGI